MHSHARHASNTSCAGGRFHDAVDSARRFLASRTADHWVMFVGGLILGLILG